MGVIPGRFEGSGGPAEAPEQRLSCLAQLQFVHGHLSLLHKGEGCRDVLLCLECGQVYGFGVCL